MRVDSWPERQPNRLSTQPYEKPTREPTCEPNAAARQDPRWYNPHPCKAGVTSCSSALAAPAHAAAGCLTLPAQAVEWQRPSWPVAPALALPLAGGPARGSVVQPVTQPVTQPVMVWAMQHDDSRGEEQNRKRTSSTNHLIGALSHSNQRG